MAPYTESREEATDDGDTRTKYAYMDRYHYDRRREILKAHPEIRQLMRIDPSFKYVCALCAFTQILVGCLLRNSPVMHIIFMGVFVGTVFTCAISNAAHELVHDQAFFEKPLLNKILGTMLSCSLGWPSFGGFYRTHRNHHSFLGTNLDAKYPSIEEALSYDQSVWGRLKYIFSHPLSFGERWHRNVNEPDQPLAIWCFRTVWCFNIFLICFVGWRAYAYLILSFWLNDCIYIQGSKAYTDHYCDDEKPHARSYYGWINYFNHNIGYHREHHDFPNIPGRYLPLVTEFAKEFYTDPVNIATSIFSDSWAVLTAPPGQGLLKHANKLGLEQVSMRKLD